MNYLEKIKRLGNRYYLMRHGESFANTQGIIVSDPVFGAVNYGLTPRGLGQVRDSLQRAIETGDLDSNVLIYHSVILRAHETAREAARVLSIGSIKLEHRLNERFFGNLNGKSDVFYDKVHNLNRLSVDHEFEGVESISRLQTRTTQLIFDLESQYKDKKFLLVSHGDPIKMLELSFLGIPLLDGQKFPYHELVPFHDFAEIREILLNR